MTSEANNDSPNVNELQNINTSDPSTTTLYNRRQRFRRSTSCNKGMAKEQTRSSKLLEDKGKKFSLSNEHYRLMVENARQHAVMFLDCDGYVAEWNKSAKKIFGYSSDEILGKHVSIFFKQNEIHKKKILRALQTAVLKHRFEENGICVRKNKSKFRSVIMISSACDEAGALTGFIAVIYDSTEQQRSEQELHTTEEKYRRMFEESLTGNYISSADGKLLDCNLAYAQIFGFASVQEASTHTVKELYHSPENYQTFLNQLYKYKKLDYFEARMRGKEGNIVYVIEKALGKFNDEGELIEIRGYMFDNTERKLLEQQLVQLQKMESLGTIAGGIAHDFNNILGIILAYSAMLEHGPDVQQIIPRALEGINKAIERGASLSRQILTFARKSELTLEPVNINAVVQSLSKMLQETFPKNIEMKFDLDSSVPIVTMDQSQLHQVLLNLCVNARDAMTAKLQTNKNNSLLSINTRVVQGKEIQRKFPDAASPQYLQIDVADTGSGIESSLRQRIFEPFFRTKEKRGGSGLGLSVVYGVVKNHNGFIDLESTVGQGTTFKLYFPLSTQTPFLYTGQLDQPSSAPGGTETILYAEDEEGLSTEMKSLMESKGYTVILARNGVEAIQLYAERKKDIALALIDMGLPKLSGSTVFSTIREINVNQKVILVSGFMDPDEKGHLIKAGLSCFIQKPYMPNNVLKTIRLILDEKV
ncbi:MAG: PAS domain S-box protein [Bacteroidota bacterium]